MVEPVYVALKPGIVVEPIEAETLSSVVAAAADVPSGQRLWHRSVQLWLPPHLLVHDEFLSLFLSTSGDSVSSPTSTQYSFPFEEVPASFCCLLPQTPSGTNRAKHHVCSDDLIPSVVTPPHREISLGYKQNRIYQTEFSFLRFLLKYS